MDHRVAMSFAVAGLACASGNGRRHVAVATSFPASPPPRRPEPPHDHRSRRDPLQAARARSPGRSPAIRPAPSRHRPPLPRGRPQPAPDRRRPGQRVRALRACDISQIDLDDPN
jgi:hypothetical protein